MNTLCYGDNIEILRKLVDERVEIDLCYIDPPFNSNKNYNQIYTNASRTDQAQAQAFVDTWTWDTSAQMGFQAITSNDGARFAGETIELFRGLWHILRDDRDMLAYLVSMTLRLVEIHRLLKPTASFYLHCDPTASHYLKLILDSIFGQGNFRNEIIWKRKAGRGETNNAAVRFGVSHDVLLFYAKSSAAPFTRQYRANNPKYIEQKFVHDDGDGRRYRLDNLTSPSDRPNLKYEYKGYPPPDKGWAVSLDRMKEMDAEGRLHFPKRMDQRIQRKRYLDELEGETVDTLWDDISPINSQAKERMGYPTQKPEALLERIINASSNPGDLILDAYCGCGTSVAVAQRLDRRWIGVDITFQSISLIVKRLEDAFGRVVMDTVRTDGIPRDLQAAAALANRKDDKTRKEFEKWAVLTYSRNRAVIREKKGSDKGIDGIAYFLNGFNETEKMVFQAKSGDVQRADIATLKGDMEREGAKLATLITLKEPTQPMKEECAQSGLYHHPLIGLTMNRIQIVTVREMIEEKKRLELPMTAEVLKTAPKAALMKTQTSLEDLFKEES